jgi:hypothetical protein
MGRRRRLIPNSKNAGCFSAGAGAALVIWVLGKLTSSSPPVKQPVHRETENPQIRPATSVEVERASTSVPTPPSYSTLSNQPAVPPTKLSSAQTLTFPAQPPLRYRTKADIDRIRRYVPREVKLTRDVDFPVINEGRNVGMAKVSNGMITKVVQLQGDRLVLEHNGRQQPVWITWTDFMDQVLAESEK